MNSENMISNEIRSKVLIDALPYIQKFNRKYIVVKYGGSAMSNEELQKNVIKDVTLLKLVGFKPIIVHGGGKEISRWVGKVGKEAKFVNGLRVTDAETMEIAEMVLNKVNTSASWSARRWRKIRSWGSRQSVSAARTEDFFRLRKSILTVRISVLLGKSQA